MQIRGSYYKGIALARKKTQEEVLESATLKHAGFYSYEYAVYTDSTTKFEIVCPVHGPFWMSPNNHLHGKGCSKCGDIRTASAKKKNTVKFSGEVELRFPGLYSFECTKYVSAREKVDVRCIKHDRVFSITPDNLLRGKGCPLCGEESRVSTRKIMFDENIPANEQKFLEDSSKVHGGRFLYLGGYRTKESIVDLVCAIHGVFKQKALVHLEGSGCPACAGYGFNPAKPGCIYVMADSELVKVGITNRAPEARAKNVRRSSEREFEVVSYYLLQSGQIARDIETELLRELRNNYAQPSEKFDGYKECFYNVDMGWLLSRVSSLIEELTGCKTDVRMHTLPIIEEAA